MRVWLNDRRWHAVGAQLGRLALLLLVIAIAGIGVTVAAGGIQSQHDETRGADLLLLVAPEVPPADLIAHSLDLYHRGYGTQIAVAGPGHVRARADLLGRGLPVEALFDAQSDSLILILTAARQSGVHNLLAISPPADQLLTLKVARDLGLQAYGSPEPARSPDLVAAIGAAFDYWRYALFHT
jgi:hypothetical protein